MAAVRSEKGRMVVVRLSEIPIHLREQEAESLAKKLGLTGIDEMLFKLRALSRDAKLRVPTEKADIVLSGKRIPGPVDPYLLGPTAELYS